MNIRSFLNTHFPLPIQRRGKRIFLGSAIFKYDGGTWEDDTVHKPSWFYELDPVALLLLNEIKAYASPSHRILDVCCNVGRHLNALYEAGYTNLSGFDIMKPAVDQIPSLFPSIVSCDIRLGNIVDILPSYQSDSFDWAFTHSATIENVHPSFPVHKHLFNKVTHGCIFLLNVNGHLYPRNYRRLFEQAGFLTISDKLILSSKGYHYNLYVWVKPQVAKLYTSPQFYNP